jgi:hypothetical protein
MFDWWDEPGVHVPQLETGVVVIGKGFSVVYSSSSSSFSSMPNNIGGKRRNSSSIEDK